MVLRNYIEFEDGVPARLHFVTGQLIDKTITDPLTRQPKQVTSLVLQVDQLNGEAIGAQLSVIQEKLAAKLKPWIDNGRLADVDFIITARGAGFLRDFEVQVLPRSVG